VDVGAVNLAWTSLLPATAANSCPIYFQK
jgi:hypothetical protein